MEPAGVLPTRGQCETQWDGSPEADLSGPDSAQIVLTFLRLRFLETHVTFTPRSGTVRIRWDKV